MNVQQLIQKYDFKADYMESSDFEGVKYKKFVGYYKELLQLPYRGNLVINETLTDFYVRIWKVEGADSHLFIKLFTKDITLYDNFIENILSNYIDIGQVDAQRIS